MKNKLKILSFLTIAVLLAIGWDVHPKTSATVPGNNEGVDRSVSGGNPNGSASGQSISQNGQYVAFSSSATNLVSSPAVTNANQQVYVRDRLNSTNQLVSVSTSSTQGDSFSNQAQISTDGRYVVFTSGADNLVSTYNAGNVQVYVRDLHTGTTQLVSSNTSGSASNNGAVDPSISADGRYIVFASGSTNLVNGTTNTQNIYLKDMSNGSLRLLSKSSSGSVGNAQSEYPSISCEGRFVAFDSMASNLTSDETNDTNKDTSNIFLVDTLNNDSVQNLTSSAAEGQSSGGASISCNGDYVSFASADTSLISGDTNNQYDIFTYDRINNSYDRVSVSTNGDQSNDSSSTSSISNDGRYVTFDSRATNLVSGDTNGKPDIFLRDRLAGTTQLISVNSNGAESNGYNSSPVISSDGRYIVYNSNATNLVSGFYNSSNAVFSSQTGASDDF